MPEPNAVIVLTQPELDPLSVVEHKLDRLFVFIGVPLFEGCGYIQIVVIVVRIRNEEPVVFSQ